MAIKLYYKEDDEFVEVTSTAPVSTTHEGKSGDTSSVQLFLKNDDVLLWYSTIVVKSVDSVETGGLDDTIYDETGWGVKLYPGDTEPTGSFWDSLDWGNEISMDDIGESGTSDTTTYYPFWYLITCPPNTDAQTKTNIKIKVEFTENAV